MLDMAAPKKPSPRGRKPPTVPSPAPTRADGRAKSELTLAGETAAMDAKRRLLLDTLEKHNWNLTATAEILRMGANAAVIRALKELAPAEYLAAKKAGKVTQANRRDE